LLEFLTSLETSVCQERATYTNGVR